MPGFKQSRAGDPSSRQDALIYLSVAAILPDPGRFKADCAPSPLFHSPPLYSCLLTQYMISLRERRRNLRPTYMSRISRCRAKFIQARCSNFTITTFRFSAAWPLLPVQHSSIALNKVLRKTQFLPLSARPYSSSVGLGTLPEMLLPVLFRLLGGVHHVLIQVAPSGWQPTSHGTRICPLGP